jgi:hypothetical protein
MSSDSKVAFLMTTKPGLDVAMQILEDASVDETIYLTEHVFDALEELPEPYTGLGFNKLTKYAEELDEKLGEFYYDISFYHTKYKTYKPDDDLYNADNYEDDIKNNQESIEKLEQIEQGLEPQTNSLSETYKVESTAKTIMIVGAEILGGTIPLGGVVLRVLSCNIPGTLIDPTEEYNNEIKKINADDWWENRKTMTEFNAEGTKILEKYDHIIGKDTQNRFYMIWPLMIIFLMEKRRILN